MDTKFTYSTPGEAVKAWIDGIECTKQIKEVSLSDATGRILASDLRSDRSSPPCSVSAMDGYVFRTGELHAGRITVAGEVLIGQSPPEVPTNQTMRIYTGSPIPSNCDRVIKREDVEEHETHIVISPEVVDATSPGNHIRYEGENMPAGRIVAKTGSKITMPVAASLAGFGFPSVKVYRKIKISILTTGDEIRAVDDHNIDPWQIRNSNGPALRALFASKNWVDLVKMEQVRDDFDATCEQLSRALQESDAVILTGGVSMGDHDYIPNAVREIGGTVIFHKLPVRPGKPVLAALGPQGQIIAGLPGNPVSVMVSAVRTALPALRKKAGFLNPELTRPAVNLSAPLRKSLSLWWYLPVNLLPDGKAEIIATKGSGDFGSITESSGFVEVPPGRTDVGPYIFRSWNQ